DLRVRRENRAYVGDELLRRHARLRGEADLVELALLLEEALRRREVEARERGAADARRAAELHEPGEPELPHRPLRLHAEHLADLEVLLPRGGRVDDDLAAPRPGAAN